MLDLSSAQPDVLVLVGTQTGNSELVAEAIAERLGNLGFAAHVLDMAEAVPESLADYRQLVVVLCTWANGTYPDNAVEYVESLEAVQPDLAHIQYGIVGLGDRDYDPYYQTAALHLDGLLRAYGATCAVPMHEIDGGPTPEDFDQSVAWAEGCATAFADASAP
ncbi:MAG: flavodoxin family protein [Bacteroidota bacterium]